MTIVKDPPKKAIVPEVVGPDTRKVARRERPGEFGSSGQGRTAVYQGERPDAAQVKAMGPPKVASKRALSRMGLTRKEATYLQALVGSKTHIEALEKAFPMGKAKYSSRRKQASRIHQSILAKIGDDGMMEAMGIGKQATYEKLRQLKDAQVIKAFIVPETGDVVEAGPYEDNQTQLGATKLLTQIHKMVPDEKGGGGGTVIVNVVQYNPPGTPPWPGGGRA
jgi:hypothetical protein